MSEIASEFFEITSIGDVTLIKLLDSAKFRLDRSKDIDLAPLISQMEGTRPQQDVHIGEQFRLDLRRFIDTKRPAKVVLDFAGLHKIGYQPIISTIMNWAYADVKRLSNSFGCQWRICGLTEQAQSYYHISSLHLIFPQIHSCQSEAVAAFTCV